MSDKPPDPREWRVADGGAGVLKTVSIVQANGHHVSFATPACAKAVVDAHNKSLKQAQP